MAKRTTRVRRSTSVSKLKYVVNKLQMSFSFSTNSSPIRANKYGSSDDGMVKCMPPDVKKGHFAVLAMEEGQTKRFVIALSYLKHPCFLRLLEQAAEEFGFDQEGAIAIPCRPQELERILIHEHAMMDE